MAAPNLAGALLINGKTAVYTATTSLASALSNGAGSGKLLKVDAIRAANLTAFNQTLSITIYRSSAHDYIIKDTVIAPNSSVVIVDKNEGVNLEEGDAIYAQAGAATSIDMIITYMDMSNI